MEIRPNRLRYCLENNIPTISTRIESPWAYMTELAAASGHFDFIEYEGEYAPHTERELEDICRAAELYGCATVVKVDRQNRNFCAQKAIACGAHGILFADLYTAEEVRETIEAITTSYPDGGIMGRPNRRLCMNGSGRMLHSDYRKMTDGIVKMIMIEKVDALKNLEEICQVPGVDMVVYGPFAERRLGDGAPGQGAGRGAPPDHRDQPALWGAAPDPGGRYRPDPVFL